MVMYLGGSQTFNEAAPYGNALYTPQLLGPPVTKGPHRIKNPNAPQVWGAGYRIDPQSFLGTMDPYELMGVVGGSLPPAAGYSVDDYLKALYARTNQSGAAVQAAPQVLAQANNAGNPFSAAAGTIDPFGNVGRGTNNLSAVQYSKTNSDNNNYWQGFNGLSPEEIKNKAAEMYKWSLQGPDFMTSMVPLLLGTVGTAGLGMGGLNALGNGGLSGLTSTISNGWNSLFSGLSNAATSSMTPEQLAQFFAEDVALGGTQSAAELAGLGSALGGTGGLSAAQLASMFAQDVALGGTQAALEAGGIGGSLGAAASALGGAGIGTGVGGTMGGITGLTGGIGAGGLAAGNLAGGVGAGSALGSGALAGLGTGINLGTAAGGGLLSGLGSLLGGAAGSAGGLLSGLGSLLGGAAGSGGGLLSGLGSLLGGAAGSGGNILGSLLGGGADLIGGLLQGSSAADAAKTQSDAILRAAQMAADAAKFRPVGVTTNFGSSNFGYDTNGNLKTAGYTLTPEMKRQQGILLGLSGQALDQYANSFNATAPMGAGAQSMFNLGSQYLGTSPEAQAAKYMADQQALLDPSRQRGLADLMTTLQNQGRLGLATGGTQTLGASNPDLESFYNAQRMQDLNLAAQATQGGMDYAKFGAGMLGLGGTTLNDMYNTQANAASPWTTALGGATNIEKLGQNAMDLGTSIGQKVSTAGANTGQMLYGGGVNAANTMAPANAYNPWATMLTNAGGLLSNYKWGT